MQSAEEPQTLSVVWNMSLLNCSPDFLAVGHTASSHRWAQLSGLASSGLLPHLRSTTDERSVCRSDLPQKPTACCLHSIHLLYKPLERDRKRIVKRNLLLLWKQLHWCRSCSEWHEDCQAEAGAEEWSQRSAYSCSILIEHFGFKKKQGCNSTVWSFLPILLFTKHGPFGFSLCCLFNRIVHMRDDSLPFLLCSVEFLCYWFLFLFL